MCVSERLVNKCVADIFLGIHLCIYHALHPDFVFSCSYLLFRGRQGNQDKKESGDHQ
jgi:hypothetical protein